MYLFFDTETTGFCSYKEGYKHEKQPSIVQIAAILQERDQTVRAELNLIIRPDRWDMKQEALEVHGISEEVANAVGVGIQGVLMLFQRLSKMADRVVAHNADFDHFMLMIEAHRHYERALHHYLNLKTFCTMKASTNIIGLPPSEKMKAKNITTPKPPSLMEAYQYFFRREFEGRAHDAMTDVRACRDIFFELLARGAGPED